MAKTAKIKVTIVGYYTISEDEIEGYDVTTFDPGFMASSDQDQINNGVVTAIEIADSWFTEDPSITLEVMN